MIRPHPDTPEFKAWFEGSHVTDNEGKPRIAFHGTRADFDTFDPAKLGAATGAPSANLGFFFSGRKRTADSYTNMVLPHEKEEHDAMFDRAQKLATSKWRSHSQDPKRKAAADAKYKESGELYDKAAQMRQAGGNVMPVYLSFKNPHIHDMKGQGYRDQSYHDIIQEAKAKGHDSAIIRNTFDAVLGDALPDDIYVAFHPHQIKSATGNAGTYNPNDPNITKSEELEKNADDLSTTSAQPVDNPAGRKSDFVVTHNLTQSNLEHADELGGLVAPSMAVAHRDHPLEGFGDVTLVAHPDMIDPKNGTPVFDADIYSPRHPKARYELDSKGYKALHQELKPHLTAIGEENTGSLSDHIEEGQIDPSNSHQPYWSAMARMFLATKGINLPVPMKGKRTRFDSTLLDAPPLQAFKERYGKNWNQGPYDLGHRRLLEDDEHHGILKELTDAAKASAKHADADLAAKTHGDPAAEDLYRDSIDYHIDHDGEDGFGAKGTFLKYHSALGLLDDLVRHGQKEPDFYTHREELKTEMQKHPEFKDWFNSKIQSAQGKQYIPNGFTASGNRRRLPYTLDNVLKLMTKKTKGGENFNYGVGSIRAQGAKKFDSLDEIRAHGHRLVGKQDMETVKKQHDAEFGEIADAIRQYHNDPGGFRVLDALSSAMAESQKRGRSVSLELTKDGFNKVPGHIVNRIRDFLKKLNSSPTEYFEAKPQRVVKLSEFKGAAVPHSADPAFIKQLRDKGMHVELYNAETKEGEHEFKRAWDEAKAAGADDQAADAAGSQARKAYMQNPNGPGSRSEAIRKIADMQKLHLSEKELLDAINGAEEIVSQIVSKSELEIPGLMPQNIEAMGTGSEKVAVDIQQGISEGLCYDVVLEGKHSAGSKLVYDEPAHRFWLLKPGAGIQSPAAGLAETKGSQAEREVAFSKIALECFETSAYPQAALLNVDGAQVAAVAMASPTYVAAQDLGDTVMNQFLRGRLDGGDLHKWAIIDYVLGNTDSHGHNMLVEQEENKVLLIDHGSSFAGYEFAPGHDPSTFVPYYLRVWNPLDWKNAKPEQLYAAMPRPQPGLDAELSSWLRDVSQNKIKQLMDAHGLDDAGAAIGRLALLQDSETPGADVIRLWSGIDGLQKSEPEKLGLPLTTSQTETERFETGKPVTFNFLRNNVKSPNMGERFQQHIEPHGRYMTAQNDPHFYPGHTLETGKMTFQNPLVMHWNSNPDKNAGYDDTSWKAHLHRTFNAKGRALSNKIAARGHDGIVTVNRDGQPSEIVDLSMFRKG